ncbi:MAG: putative membrane-bound dehydrogenase-like protein [Limisphaerales bacterium]
MLTPFGIIDGRSKPPDDTTMRLVTLLLSTVLFARAQSDGDVDLLSVSPPTPGERAAKEFKTLDGFKMTLLAEEPLVTDPVAICYDADGRAYVAEMNDYPYTDKAKHLPMRENQTDQAIGKIRLLTDVDGDGVFDKSSVFANGLSWPSGVVPWQGGVFVTAAPDFWYFKDTDDDGVADVRQKITSGFRKYNVQSAVNTPVWGLDNRIYIATARNKGDLSFGSDDTKGRTALPGGRDLRIDPRTLGEFELVSGGIQFGNAFDDWGNRFLCSAGNSVHHAVLPAEAFRRNPWLPSRTSVRACFDPKDPIQLFPITEIEGWRLRRYQDRKFVPRRGYTESRGSNPGDPSRPTSSCGPAVYRGDAYPDTMRGVWFVAESCYNLVYRLDSASLGGTFQMRKPATDRTADVIASRDVWFRPMTLVNAPDGCLHLADMYRESIEHPWSLPDSFHSRMDMLRGRDRGRIYRIEPANYRLRAVPKLSQASSISLVSLLGHKNAWHRETAHRLLFERQDKTVVNSLKRMALGDDRELARLHALWTLHGLDSLEPDMLTKSLADESPGLRANALRLAAMMLPGHPELLTAIRPRAEDSDPAVRFQAALAMGANQSAVAVTIADDETAKALASIARRDGADPWTRLAALSSSVPHAGAMLNELLTDEAFLREPYSGGIVGPLARIIGAKNQYQRVSALISQLAGRGDKPDAITLGAVIGLADGFRNARTSLAKVATKTPESAAFLKNLIAEARILSADGKAGAARRIDAIKLLENASFEEVGADLKKLLNPIVPAAVQASAAATLSRIGSRRTETGELLLVGWDGYTGELRNQILQLLLAREERLEALFDAIESGKIQPYQLGAARREMLVAHKNPNIAKRARKLFSGADSRAKVLEKYRAALTLDGDPAKGEAVYQLACMPCHKLREKGIVDLAPNLAVVADWESERILTNIIDPNRDVAPEYMEYVAETKSGDVLTGRVVAENDSGITIRMADNSSRDIPRADIKTLTNSGRSLMPDGLEAAFTVQSLADLIAYLKHPQ